MATTYSRSTMVVVPVSTPLREAVAMAHQSMETAFAVDDNGQIKVIEALEIFNEVRRIFGGKMVRELEVLRELLDSDLPVLKALEWAHIDPVRISVGIGRIDDLLASDVHPVARGGVQIFALDRFEPGRFRASGPIANSFSCVWLCESKLHYWPCADGNRPDFCENDKPWTTQTTI